MDTQHFIMAVVAKFKTETDKTLNVKTKSENRCQQFSEAGFITAKKSGSSSDQTSTDIKDRRTKLKFFIINEKANSKLLTWNTPKNPNWHLVETKKNYTTKRNRTGIDKGL